MMSKSYETIAEEEFASISAVNYHASKLFSLFDVTDKKSFVSLFSKYIQFDISKTLDSDIPHE